MSAYDEIKDTEKETTIKMLQDDLDKANKLIKLSRTLLYKSLSNYDVMCGANDIHMLCEVNHEKHIFNPIAQLTNEEYSLAREIKKGDLD